MSIQLEEDIHPLGRLALQDFSYSRLNTYMTCPLQYYYSYILKEPQTFGVAATLGNILHKALEVTLEHGEEINLPELIANYHEAIPGYDPDNLIPDNMIDDGLEMLRSYKEDHPGEMNVYAKELPFSFVLGPARFNGFIDLVSEHDTYVQIRDYKCFPEETLVQMATGEQRMARNVQVGDVVVGYENGLFVQSKVLDKFDNGEKRVKKLTTTSGKELTCTLNHPILTQNGWVKMEHINTSHKIVSNIDPNEASWHMLDSDVDYHDAYFLGAITGDGTTTGVSTFRFTNADTKIVDFMTRKFESKFNLKLKNYISDGCNPIDYNVQHKGSSIYREYLENHGLLGHTSHTKRIPKDIFTSGVHAWRGFLAGYFDTDGHVRYQKDNLKPNIVINSMSKGLLQDCQVLLSYMGIKSQVIQINSTYKTQPHISWRLSITNRNGVVKFAQKIVSMIDRKQDVLNVIVSDCQDDLCNVFTPDMLYDQVVAVESMGIVSTIGLTIDGAHTHVTNGLVTHNSGKKEVTYAEIPNNLQLGIYALYCKSLFPDKEIRAELYYLRKGKARGHIYTDDDLLVVENRLLVLVNEILDLEDFKPTPNERNCRNLCSYGKDGTCSTGQYRINRH